MSKRFNWSDLAALRADIESRITSKQSSKWIKDVERLGDDVASWKRVLLNDSFYCDLLKNEYSDYRLHRLGFNAEDDHNAIFEKLYTHDFLSSSFWKSELTVRQKTTLFNTLTKDGNSLFQMCIYKNYPPLLQQLSAKHKLYTPANVSDPLLLMNMNEFQKMQVILKDNEYVMIPELDAETYKSFCLEQEFQPCSKYNNILSCYHHYKNNLKAFCLVPQIKNKKWNDQVWNFLIQSNIYQLVGYNFVGYPFWIGLKQYMVEKLSPLTSKSYQCPLEMVQQNKVSALYGPAGCGKTEFIKRIASQYPGCWIGSFIGFAVDVLYKRLKDVDHVYGITTIHKFMLRHQHQITIFPLLIIDEASTLSEWLCIQLLSKVKFEKILFVGDPNQIVLNGFGNGALFGWLCKRAAHCSLTTIHRQSSVDSQILIRNAESVLKGVRWSFNENCKFLPSKEWFSWMTSYNAKQWKEDIMCLVLTNEECRKYNRQIVQYLHSSDQTSFRIRDNILFPSAVKRLKSNLYDLYHNKRFYTTTCQLDEHKRDLFRTGEQECIKQIWIGDMEKEKSGWMSVTSNEIKNKPYVFQGESDRYWTSTDNFQHAYVITIDRSQGTEKKIVCLNLMDVSSITEHFTKSRLYVAVTRPREQFFMVGDSIMNKLMKVSASKYEEVCHLDQFLIETSSLNNL